jgi:hypothetical protein
MKEKRGKIIRKRTRGKKGKSGGKWGKKKNLLSLSVKGTICYPR